MATEAEAASSSVEEEAREDSRKDQSPNSGLNEAEQQKISLEPSEDDEEPEGNAEVAASTKAGESILVGNGSTAGDTAISEQEEVAETKEDNEDVSEGGHQEENNEEKEVDNDTVEETQHRSEDAGEAAVGAPAAVIIRPTLRGTFNDEEGTWIGQWAMNASEFENGLRGSFEYKREKKVPDTDVAKPPMVEGQPRDLYVSGYFTLLQNGKMKKIPEKDILMRFTPAEDGSILVQGFGKNNIGAFSLSGTFEPVTSSLNLDREYSKPMIAAPPSQTKAQQQKKKAATPRSTPRAAPSGDMTWGSSGPAAVSGPAAAVSQRARRAPPRVDDSEVDANKKNTARMLPIVDKLLKADVRQFFHYPVDPVLLGIPHYPDIITDPMDLGTVRQNLLNGVYENEDQVAEHILLTFRNAMTFNPKETIVYTDAKQLLATFESERSKMVKKPVPQEKEKKRKSTGGAVDGKRMKTAGRQASMRSEDSRYSSGDDEDYLEGPTIPYNRPTTKSGRRSAPASHYDPYYQPAAAAPASGSSEEELRLLRKQMEMMSQQLESLKALQSAQVQQMQHATSPRSMSMGDSDYGVPTPMPKRARAPPKPKSRPSYSAPSAMGGELDEDFVGEGPSRGPKLERQLSFQEKRALGNDINKLPAEKIQGVIDIIAESDSQMLGEGAEEVEIDIEKLDNSTLKKLQKYVREVLRGEKKKAINQGAM